MISSLWLFYLLLRLFVGLLAAVYFLLRLLCPAYSSEKIGVNFHVIPYMSSIVILHTSDRRRRRVSGDTLASLVIASVDARRWDCL